MKYVSALLWLWLLVSGAPVLGQDIIIMSDEEMNGVLKESGLIEDNTTNLILDNTRTKIGRDFYETFYRLWAQNQIPVATDVPGDSVATGATRPDVMNQEEFLITIDEMPTPNVGTTVISITINDQLLWQQFLQARLDILEALGANAVEVVSQYIANYREIQAQMNTEDQSGSGIF